MRGTPTELLGSDRGIVCRLSIAPRIALGAFAWFGKRDFPIRRPLLPPNAGTAEPVRVSPPEAVAYQLELEKRSRIDQIWQPIDFIPIVKLDAITLCRDRDAVCSAALLPNADTLADERIRLPLLCG